MSMDATESNEPSAGAKRMRLYRRRRQSGERLVQVQLSEIQVDKLIRKKYLGENSRNDQEAIHDALEWCVFDTLFEPVTHNAR